MQMTRKIAPIRSLSVIYNLLSPHALVDSHAAVSIDCFVLKQVESITQIEIDRLKIEISIDKTANR